MAIQPTSSIEWASDPSALKTESTPAHKQYGWGIVNGLGEIPNLNEVNYWRFSVYEWITYLNLQDADRVTDIAAVNTRIDNLSSDQVSYEFSNEDSGNIYAVPYTTFTEFDGTTSTQYTDNGTLTTIENVTNSKGVGVLSKANPNNTNDTLASDLSVYADQVLRLTAKPISCANRYTGNLSLDERFKTRFKYSLEKSLVGNQYVRYYDLKIAKYNPNTGNYNPPVTVWTANSGGNSYFEASQPIVSDDAIGIIISTGTSYDYVFYDVKNEELMTGAVPVPNTLETSRISRYQGWIVYPKIGDVYKPTFIFMANWKLITPQLPPLDFRFTLNMVNSDGLKLIKGQNTDFFRYGDFMDGSNIGWQDDYAFDCFLDPSQDSTLIINVFKSSWVKNNGTDPAELKFFGGDEFNTKVILSFTQPEIPKDFYWVTQATSNLIADPNNLVQPANPSLTDIPPGENVIRCIWSDLEFGEPSGVMLIGIQAKLDSLGTQIGGAYKYNFYIIEETGSGLSVAYADNIHPPINYATGVTEGVSGISSIDLVKKEGNVYTFTLGFLHGNVETDSATVYTLLKDYTWDGSSFSEVAGSEVLSSTLTDDEVAKWKLARDDNSYCNLSVKVDVSAGVRRLTLFGDNNPYLSPWYQAEVYNDGYFVFFKANNALIYGDGGSQPPGKPSWAGTTRAIYSAGTPGAGENTIFTSSLNNTITSFVNDLDTNSPLLPQGIFDLVDGQTYSYGMSKFIPAAEAPAGLSVQFTSVTFVQYDAFINGLGNVQAALDNLYAQIGSVYDLEAFGGTTVSTDFNNHVLSLVTPQRYTATGISLTSGVATTITHNLDQEIVQIAVYDESNDQLVDVDVILVDANSLTITASSTITVSVVVLK